MMVTEDERVLVTHLPDKPHIEEEITAMLREPPCEFAFLACFDLLDISTDKTTAFLLVLDQSIAIVSIRTNWDDYMSVPYV